MKERPIKPRVHTKAEVQPEPSGVIELVQGIYQLRGEKPGSHVYLIKGDTKNVLVDTGIAGRLRD